MRPVNLIPPEERRGERAPLRSGPLSYLIVAVLGVALVAVTAMVMTGNTVKERQAEVASLEVREADARARAQSLNAFAEFASLAEARTATVTSLAQSRFDWERVLEELALVIPDDVWLVSLSGTVTPGAVVEGGASVSLRESVPGPALSMIGCGEGHDAVAEFLQALKDIDGVTRVGINGSELSGAEGDGAGEGDCRTRDFITRFEIVAAFDAVPVPSEARQAPDATAEQTGEARRAADGVVAGVAR